MTNDPRDEIWNAAYQSYYETYYAEIVEDALLSRWVTFDHVTKILIAFTSSGSAIAGLALWKLPEYSWLWPVLTALSASLALIAKQFSVTEKLREHPISCNAFSTLRIDFENFRIRMRINTEFPVEEFQKEFLSLRKKYAEEMKRVQHDIFLTKGLREDCQTELNNRLNTSLGQGDQDDN